DAIQRRSECNQSITRDPAIAAHHCGNSAERAGLADRSASISTEGRDSEARCDDRSGAAAGPTGNAVGCDRIFDWAVGGVFVGAAHGEFVAICFAEDHSACGFETRDGGGIVWWDIVLQDFGAASRGCAAGAEYIFDGDGNTG